MSRILLLRAVPPEEERALPHDVDLLVTHEVVPIDAGIGEALAFDPARARLVVTSRTTVRVLVEAGAGSLFEQPFTSVLAAGEATAGALREAGARAVVVPDLPGAEGIVEALRPLGVFLRLLWPRGADADPRPFGELGEGGAVVCAPVVYDKLPAGSLDEALLSRFSAGGHAAVAVASLAALDVLLSALSSRGLPVPPVRWGALGPATARAFASRGLPEPAVPDRARLDALLDLLRNEVNR